MAIAGTGQLKKQAAAKILPLPVLYLDMLWEIW